MSSAPTQLAVAPTASNLVSSTAQIQKDYLEEPLARQNSLGNRVRGGLKGKHLTRSHAMRESASPPRTPTPRSSEQQHQLAQSPVSTSYSSSSSETINDSNNKMHVQSSSLSTSPSSLETPSVIVTSQHSQQQQQQQIHSSNDNNNINFGVVCNQSQLDLDFPKLTPPKSSKCPRNRDQSQSSDKQQQQQQLNSNTIDYNNKLSYNNSTGISGGGNNNLSLVDSIPTTGSSSNTSYNNKNGNKMNNDNLITKSSSSSTSSNGHNMMNNHIQNVSQINWNRQNSPPLEQQTGGRNSNLNNSPPHMTYNDNNNKDNRYCPRIESQNSSSNSGTFSIDDNQSESPTDGLKCSDRLNKKHKSGANSKSSKPRLKNMGSSSSVEGGNSTSGFISRDSSTEQFTDQSGVDLVQFFRETLNKNPKDRSMLMKIEKDLLELAHDNSRTELKFPAMSSYNRMLIHRVAAFFGMEHNVDATTQQCVIVATTKSTRIPDIRFKSLFRERLSDEPPRRSILKRDTHSFEDPRQSFLMCPDNRGILDRKAKSFEEREEEYEKVRRRIFKRDGYNDMNINEHYSYWPWSSSESSDQSARMRQQHHNNKLLKVHSLSDGRQDGRPSVSKSHSFGGYGGPPPSGGPLARGDSINSTKSAGPRLFSKQDSIGSTNTPWRLSPSSSGYKTQTQSLRSDSITPSPTGCGSDDHTPEPSVIHVVHDTISSSASSASCGVVWAVTDMASVPRGSVLINPQTLQPIVNQDGSIYHFDPSNLPPSQSVPSAMYNNTKNIGINTSVHRKKNEKLRGVGRGGNEIHNTVTSGSDISNSNCEEGNNVTGNHTSGTEGSIETLSESSSAQTVVVNSCNRDDITTTVVIDNDAQEITKENHCHREMSDIQEETICNSIDENDKLATNSNEHLNNIQQQKPKVKNQATSPNIPSPEPEEIQQVNEVTNTTSIEISPSLGTEQQQTNNSSTTIAIINSTSSSPPSGSGGSVGNGVISSSSSTADHHHQHTNRKDTLEHFSKITPQSSSGPLMTYAHSYQSVDGTTVFQQPASSGPYPATTYQQGPDGSVYAVPQPMVYAYPPQMEGEIQGYFMPVFDQSVQRDANGTLLPTTTQAIYQPTGGATTAATTVVPVAAYPTAQYGSAPIYQGQVLYSPATADQYAPTAASATGQMQQYPMTYPVGYPYPYNGYWGQAMTYYVPQPIPGSAVSSSMIPPPLTAATPVAATAINGGTNPINVVSSSTGGNNTNGNGGNKRNSPHQQNLSNGQNSQSVSTTAAAVAANTTYQFAPGVPLALASDPNGQTMYAIPQSAAAVFPNMLPYGHPSTPAAAAAGVLTPLPHQQNAVISSLISHPTGPNGPHIPLEQPSAAACAANYAAAISSASVNGTNYGTNSCGTPQSTPSTPLSTNVSTNIALPPQMRSNHPPALFATPSIIPNGYTTTTNSQLHNHHHYHQVDSPNAGTATTNSLSSSYDKKNGGGGGGNVNKKNSISSNYSSNNRQNSNAYSHNQQQNSRKQSNTNENSNSSNNSQQNSSRQLVHNNHSSQQLQQKQRSNEKQNSGGMSGILINSNICAQNNNSDKSRSGGGNGNVRPKPGNLDLRRNATSQRNSPSTNSIESSNNSPNSIAGSSNHNTSYDYSHQSIYMTTRGAHHIQPMHPPSAAAVVAAAAAAAVVNDPTACHQPLIGAYNHHPPPPSGMYIKYGQAYFAHPSVALPSNRRSPPNDLRPPIGQLTGVYPAVNMMLSAPRHLQPRHPNPNYKGKSSR